ncbi:MAG: DUF3618 domain-containing protein [Thermoanaerobaculia bacterium]
MAERADALSRDARSPDRSSGGRRSLDEIERDIEQTRADMGRTIDDIQYQLSPDTIKRKAKVRMREGSRTMMDRIKQNPAAAALIGVGAWMLFRGRDQAGAGTDWDIHEHVYATGYCEVCGVPVDIEASGRGERLRGKAHEAKERVGHAAHETKERVGEATHEVAERAADLGHRVSERTGRAANRTRIATRRTTDRLEDNPLLLGALGLAAGAILGGLLPESDREREMFGDARERTMERARELAREKSEQVRHVAEAAKDAAVEEGRRAAERENLTSEREAVDRDRA